MFDPLTKKLIFGLLIIDVSSKFNLKPLFAENSSSLGKTQFYLLCFPPYYIFCVEVIA